ncbi:M6 family metalloprotease domain-containing protein [Desulfosoma sp.]
MLKKLFIAFLVPFLCLIVSQESYGVPAAPVVHTLSQPDGTTFNATLWGDENMHGWQTEEGYTIVFDQDLNSWTYAVHAPDGSLVSSSRIVGKDPVPPSLEKELRPVGEALKRIIFRRHSKEPDGHEPSENMPLAPEDDWLVSDRTVPLTGTSNIPVVLINFSNTTTTYTSSNFDSLLFGTGNYSVKDYYQEVSYGVFSVSPGPSGVAGWYKASNTHDYYGQNNSSGEDKWPGDLVYEAVAAADAAGFNFAPYDQDGDCYVDVVGIIHQGTGEEASGKSTDIWSHRWNLKSAYKYGYSHYSEYTTNDRCATGGYVKVNDYTIQPEIYGFTISTIGVFAHEYGHALGLPDLYDRDYSSYGVGKWSLMALGSWNYSTVPGDRPAHLDAWSKYKLGWVRPTQVTGTLANEFINQVETYPDVYKLLGGTPDSGEYFLVENRQKTGFDLGLPGAGLLIWHIDAAVPDNDDECYPGGPSCSKSHYKVALVQADNRYDLEKKANKGDTGDPYPGSTNNKTFSASSSPNSNLYNGSPSNASVTSISSSGTAMTATLTVNVQTYTLTVNKSGTGSGTVTSSPSGISCGVDCSEAYPANTTVVLTAAPAAGSTFAGWSGGNAFSCGTSPTCTITINANTTITATFNLKQYQVTADVSGNGSGSISSNPAGINFSYPQSSTGSATFNHGTNVALVANANSGSTAAWTNCSGTVSGNGTSTATCTFNSLDGPKTAQATFTQSTPLYTLTVNKSGTGSGTVTSNPSGINCGSACSGQFTAGTSVTLTATPASGSAFSGWSQDCASCGKNASCQITMDSDKVCTSKFKKSRLSPADSDD